MVWNDTMGSLGRKQAPAAREIEQKEKDRQKRAMERSNAKDLNELDSYIQHITGLHHEAIGKIDWSAVCARAKVGTREHELSLGVLQGDDGALLTAIKSQQSLSKIHKLGRGLGFSIQDGVVHAVLSLHQMNIVPDFQFKMMPSGKLVEVKRPREKSMRLYRAYAASAALKVASDILRIVPREGVVVSCIAPCHVADSDFDEEWPVLSVGFRNKELMALDMLHAEPTAALKLFKVSEAFHPAHGFGRIAPIIDIPVRMAI